MTYQQLQAMNSTTFSDESVSMSDLDEAERWAQAHGLGEDLYDPDGQNALGQLFGPGSADN